MVKRRWRGGPKSSRSYTTDYHRQSSQSWERKQQKKGKYGVTSVRPHYRKTKKGSTKVKHHKRRFR